MNSASGGNTGEGNRIGGYRTGHICVLSIFRPLHCIVHTLLHTQLHSHPIIPLPPAFQLPFEDTHTRSQIHDHTILLRFLGMYNLESSQTLGFHLQCLHYKPVSNHFCSKGGGVKTVSRGDCE